MTFIVYEDKLVIAYIPEKPMVPGHIRIQPRKKARLLSDLNPEEVEHLFYTASYSATILFEGLQAHGTNIILTEKSEKEEDPQLCIDVISRIQEDGLNFQWQPLKLEPLEMDKIADQLKDKADYFKDALVNNRDFFASKGSSSSKTITPKSSAVIKEEEDEEGNKKTNYLLKSLHRIP